MGKVEWVLLVMAGYLLADGTWWLIAGDEIDWGETMTAFATCLVACLTFPRQKEPTP